jgi:protease-4
MREYYDQFLSAASQGRNLDEVAFRTLAAKTPLGAAEAVSLGLADRLGYGFELKEELSAQIQGARMVEGYFYEPRVRPRRDKRIAIVYAVGVIMPDQTTGPLSSDVVTPKAFYDLWEMVQKKQVDGVLLRVDSPGGAFAPTHEIMSLLGRIAEHVPLVASLGTTAASGGYMIALPAAKIYAASSTITGSIGVYGGAFSVGGLSEKIGLDFDTIVVGGDVVRMASVSEKLTAEGRRRFNEGLNRIYRIFSEEVMRYRQLSLSEVNRAARGRVWRGAGAREVGLVDAIGGIGDALAELKTKIGVNPDDQVAAVILPTRADKITSLLRSFLYNSHMSYWQRIAASLDIGLAAAMGRTQPFFTYLPL